MSNLLNNNKSNELILYNNILSLSRNKFFYTKLGLADTFQNRISLIFFHISFIFIKINKNKEKKDYKIFYQKLFDTVFNQIEKNMRELGYGDVNVNKNMKFLVKSFYNILFFCEKFTEKRKEYNQTFFDQSFKSNNIKKTPNYDSLIAYFKDFQSFCFDLSSDSVLKGEFKFKFN